MNEKAIEAAAEALFRFKHRIGSDWSALVPEWQKQYYRDEVAPIIAAYEAGIDRKKPTHRHKKSGTEYVLIGYGNQPWHLPAARAEGPSVDMREVAIYRSVDDGSEWVLPREEFHDGRFEEIATRVSANDYPAIKAARDAINDILRRDGIASLSMDLAEAAIAAYEKAMWRPIEEAPKDGTDVLLYAPETEFEGRPVPVRITLGHWTDDEESRTQIGDCGGECRCPEYSYHEPYWLSWDGGFLNEMPPTHFRPLPKPEGI